MEDWNVLRQKDIILLIIGNNPVMSDMLKDYKMPYMTGDSICEFSKKLGLNQRNVGNSRWTYMDELLKYVIDNNKIQLFFKELLNLKRFKGIEILGYEDHGILSYYKLVEAFFVKLNNILLYDKCHIEYNLDINSYNLIIDNKNIQIESEEIKEINNEYVVKLYNQIYATIKQGDYESSVTKSRALLEEVMTYGLEKRNINDCSMGNIIQLYGEFKSAYNIQQEQNDKKISAFNRNINDLISGMNKIIKSIAEIRDFGGDSHGKGKNRYKIEEHHALLVANTAISLSSFFISVINNYERKSNNQ